MGFIFMNAECHTMLFVKKCKREWDAVSSISSCDEQDPGYCQHIGQGVQRVMPTNRIATGLQRVKLHDRGCGCMQAQGLHSAKGVCLYEAFMRIAFCKGGVPLQRHIQHTFCTNTYTSM